MQKLQVLIVSLLVTILVVGCTGAKADSQIHKVGKLILNQKGIKTIEVFKGDAGQPNITVSDSKKVSALINKVKEIPVKRLSKSEDNNFMSIRILDESKLTVYYYGENVKSLQGMIFIWPDGYIYAVDINSMKGNERSISYLSDAKYPDIYKWIIDSASASKISTQYETASQFVKSQGYQIMVNSGANFDLQLPSSFDEIRNGIQIGDLLKKRNEISKQNGLDFSGYLGKQITLITYGIENEKNVVGNINLVMDGNKIVGFWIDNHGDPSDFSVIISAYLVE